MDGDIPEFGQQRRPWAGLNMVKKYKNKIIFKTKICTLELLCGFYCILMVLISVYEAMGITDIQTECKAYGATGPGHGEKEMSKIAKF